MTVKMRNQLAASEVQELHDRLMGRLSGLMVPTLPHVAQEVLRLVSDPDSSLRDYGSIIKADQSLTAKLIRMANSALYAQRNPATTIERAMIVLGLSRLKAVVLGFQLVNTGGQDPLSKRRWSESVLRGWLAHAITAHFEPRSAGEAFIIGLMLDAGIPLMSKLLGEKYIELVSPDLPPGKAYAIEHTRLPFTHADVTAVMARAWNFPASLSVPMARHHDPMPAPDLKDTEQLLRAAAYYTGALDLTSTSQGGVMDPDRFLPSVAHRVFALSRDTLASLIQQACADYAATRELFGSAIDQRFDVDRMLQLANESLVSQIDDLLARSPSDPSDTGTRIIEAHGRRLAFTLIGPGCVRVVVADATGKPLFIDEVLPLEQSPEEVRATLLMEDAAAGEFDMLMGQLRELAA